MIKSTSWKSTSVKFKSMSVEYKVDYLFKIYFAFPQQNSGVKEDLEAILTGEDRIGRSLVEMYHHWSGVSKKYLSRNVLWLKWFQRNIEETDRDGSFQPDWTGNLAEAENWKKKTSAALKISKIHLMIIALQQKKYIDWVPPQQWLRVFSVKVVLLTSKVISNLTDAWRRR